MFIGSYDYNLDDKGRLVVPSKFRNEIIGTKLYLMKGFEGCISIFREEEFNATLERLNKLQFEKEKNRAYLRLLLETVVEMEIDSVGRMKIPTTTLKEYQIGKGVKIVGLIDHFEIWDIDAWKKYKSVKVVDFEKDAEELFDYEN